MLKFRRFILAVFITLVVAYFLPQIRDGQPILQRVFSNETCQKQSVIKKQYISSLCNCAKVIPVISEETLNSRRFRWCSVESDLRGYHQRVVSFTLFGDPSNETNFVRYYSLIMNLSQTMERQYPGWTIRFYHSFTDQQADRSLCHVYCRFPHVDLCSVRNLWDSSTSPIDPTLLKGLNRRMYRYLVMLDPRVDVFISRDVDSFILTREVDAVEEWLRSNYTFHVMRDHPLHGGLMLAGMWGAKIYQRRELIENLTLTSIMKGQDQIKDRDQVTLDTIIWPVAKFDVLAHDNYHCQNGYIIQNSPLSVFPFPTRRNGSYFVGSQYYRTNWTQAQKCPVACRPLDHQDWEYC